MSRWQRFRHWVGWHGTEWQDQLVLSTESYRIRCKVCKRVVFEL